MNDINIRAGCTINSPQIAAITYPSNIPTVPAFCTEGTDVWPDR